MRGTEGADRTDFAIMLPGRATLRVPSRPLEGFWNVLVGFEELVFGA